MDGTNRVYLANLSFTVAKHEIMNSLVFYGLPGLQFVRIWRKGSALTHRHCSAFLTFENSEQAQRVVEAWNNQQVPTISDVYVRAELCGKAAKQVKNISSF